MVWIRRLLGLTFCATVGLWLTNNATLLHIPEDQHPKLIAHRGVHQIYAGTDRNADTCNADPIHPPQHAFIANTLPSIHAAFAHGADVVEIDVHLTTDKVFALFHDWTLDCQTDGTGITHKQDFAYLRTLDVGHGFTADGTLFPLRGTAIGMIPRLSDLLSNDIAGELLVNVKSNRADEGRHLAQVLQDQTLRARVFGVYGGDRPIREAMLATPNLRGFGKAELKACLKDYILLGWSSHVPQSCRNRLIAVPMDYAPLLWGWPHRFTQRMKAHGTKVILWGPHDGSGFSSGIDDADTLARVPDHFDGYIWTNRIEVIGPLLKK